jgi:hypothetical protein
MGSMDKPEAGTTVRPESILEVRVEMVHTEPSIWRQLEIRGSLALHQVHQVLRAAFDWEDAHLHRFIASDPFAPLRRVTAKFRKSCSGFPGRNVTIRGTGARRSAPWISCSPAVPAQPPMNTILATVGCTGSNWFPAGRQTAMLCRPCWPPAPGAARWKTPEDCPDTRKSWMLWPTRPIRTTPNILHGSPK